MEKRLVNPTIKNLFVVLVRESLEDRRCKNEECNKDNQGINKDASCNNILTKEPRVTRSFLPYSTQISGPVKKQKLPCRTLNVDKVENVVCKECVIVLQKLHVNILKQSEEVFQPELVPASRNTSINTLNDPKESTSKSHLKSKTNKAQLISSNFRDEVQTDKHIFPEKLPIYKQITLDQTKTNNDQYEFDELDSDKVKDTNGIKRKLNRKKKVNFSKCLSRVNKKKHKTDTKRTYDTVIQEIVQKVMKKVHNEKFENKNLTLENNVSDKCKQNRTLPKTMEDNDNDLYNKKMDNDTSKEPEQNYENDGELNDPDDNSKGSKQNDENDAENNNFDDYYLYSPVSSRKKINIISNVILDNADTSFFFDDVQPDANSTVISARKSNPWRFGSNLKRNPHYLSIKKTALPCLQQDMILDYNLLKEIEKYFGRIPKKLENPEKEIVPSEPEYISETNKENIPDLGLFDNENFIAAQEKSPDNNLSAKRQKRNILGPISQNIENIAKPKNIPEKIIVHNQTLPRQEVLEKSNTEEKLDENINTSINDKADVPKLFEDEEPNFNFNESSKIYIPRVRKKKKILFDNELSNHHIKNEMTKTEQAELDQWAAKFNSMCEEIENYTLELE